MTEARVHVRPLVLVVGGSSSVAHSVVPLLRSEAAVLTAGRSGCDLRIDLTEPIAVWELPERFDVLVNLAADVGRGGFAALEQAVTVNSLGALRMCHAAAQAGARHIVHISSIHASLPSCSPLYSAYSISKRHGEELVQAACEKLGIPLTILRPTRLFGSPARFRHLQPALYTILNRVAAGENVFIRGGHDPLRNFLHVEDLAEVIARCVNQSITGSFNCVSPNNITLGAIASAAISAFDSRSLVHIVREGLPIVDDAHDWDDRPYAATGYFPTRDLEGGLRSIAMAWECAG